MSLILCSTGAVSGRANGNDYRVPLQLDAQLPCDGWEFLMPRAFYGMEEEICRAWEGANVVTFHVNKNLGELVSEGKLDEVLPLFEANCRFARQLGAQLLVHHLWGGIASDQHIERNIASYAPLREMAERHGLTLTVENVVCNQQDPMTHMRELVEAYPDILFTFDTKMAAFHSQLEALYLPENAWFWPRIAHLHVNDYAGGHMDWAHMGVKPLGQGHIDFGAFFAFLGRIGYAGSATCEATVLQADGTVRVADMADSLAAIRKGLNA